MSHSETIITSVDVCTVSGLFSVSLETEQAKAILK